ETFAFADDDGESLSEVAELDTLVTVVDARNFLNDFGSSDQLVDRQMGLSDEDDRIVVDLITEQVEFANVILLNKCDQVDEDEKHTVLGILRNLNPRARIIETVRGRINPAHIVGTGLFSLDESGGQPGWLEAPRGREQPETDEYGITSFVYHARRPFHAQRLWEQLDLEDGVLTGVVRSKGFLWIASRHDNAYAWSQAGVSLHLKPVGLWWAAAPDERWPDDCAENAELLADIHSNFEEPFGDRRQEIVFIGIEIDRPVIESMLEACLLTDEEMREGPAVWSRYDDPLPAIELDADDTEPTEADR
ncbi:MAG: GTP-binding protein, partial [Planctomycetota bacterium]